VSAKRSSKSGRTGAVRPAQPPSPAGPPIWPAAIAVWAGVALLLIGNEVLRVATYRPAAGRVEGDALAAVAAAALIVVAARVWVALRPSASHRAWVRVGRIWMILTVAFEMAWAWYTATEGASVFERYDLFSGRIGLIVPLTALLAPPLWSRRLYRRIDMRARFRP
jgi:hypothetical protein